MLSSGGAPATARSAAVPASDSVRTAPALRRAATLGKGFSVETMRTLLDGKQATMKNRVREWVSANVDISDAHNWTTREYRERVLEWAKKLCAAKLIPLTSLRDNPSEFFAFFEGLGFSDQSLAIKMVVQYSLWGSTIINLGTERHQEWVPQIESLAMPGCFGLTELGHGTNVRGAETEARYCAETRTFDIHSPREQSQKFWLGNAAKHGQFVTVFARLILDDKDHGVHAFVVPFRDEHGVCAPGVTVRDCGQKMGFNGIDNGGILFTHVKIPRENMLNRFSEVRPDGTYVCHVPPRRHFGATLGTLVGGRAVIGGLALSCAKVGLAVAVRYNVSRLQFGAAATGETCLLEFPTTQRMLMSGVACLYTMDAVLKAMGDMFDGGSANPALLHVVASGAKAVMTWNASKVLWDARDSMGGQGYRAINRVSGLLNDSVMYTFGEGLNTALMRQVTQHMLGQYAHGLKAGKFGGLLKHMNKTHKTYASSSNVGDLLSPKLQQAALEFREGALVKAVHARVAAAKAAGKDTFTAFNDNLTLAVQAAFAFTDRYEWESMGKLIAAAPCAKVAGMLTKLRHVHTLNALHKNAAWFATSGFFSAKLTNALDDALSALCADLRNDALPLVEAFGVPEACLPQRDGMAFGIKELTNTL